MSLVDEQYKFLRDVSKLVMFAADNGIVITGGELWRTREQQERYVATGLSKTMDSKHLKRLAIDLNVIKDGKLATSASDYKALGDYWESLSPSNRWGGRFTSFTDAPHFERNV